MTLRVVTAAPQTLIEDAGRPHLAALGVATGGALDRAAWRLGNRLVGNADGAAGLEVLLGGLTVVAEAPTVVAVTGAPGPITVDGRPVASHRAIVLERGQTVQIGHAVRGLRRYLAMRGGIEVPRVLGSRSTDPVTGIGPAPVQSGDVLVAGGEFGPIPVGDLAESVVADGAITVRALRGPRDDWLTTEAVGRLTRTAWRVSADSDRVGLRLNGGVLDRAVTRELPSELVVRGAVQVPASGEPLIFLADHPTTGGYPVVAVVIDADLDRLAQARPGDVVRFALRS